MDRRRFLGVAGGLLAACGGGSDGAGTGMNPAPATGPAGPGTGPGPGPGNPPVVATPGLTEGQPLRALARVANTSSSAGVVEASLTAAPVDLELVTGIRTTFWAYNGAVPGPLLEATEGDRVRVTFVNNLPQESTIHWHGMPVPAAQDGNPMDPVAPGATRVYEFTLPDGSAASYWYHPHAHRVTHEQVYRGLAGAFIVRPRTDPLPGLVDTPLVISDLRLDAAGRIAPNTPMDYQFGREGDALLVNGGRRPVLTGAPNARHRLRLFNATNARYLRLAFDNAPLTLIATDGGLLSAPVVGLTELLLAPGERAEVSVAFAGDTALRALAYDRGSMMSGMTASTSELILTVRVQGAPATPVNLPSTLQSVVPLSAETASKRFVLGPAMMMGGMAGMTMGAFTINGRSFDMDRIDATSRLGAVELWEVVNPTGMDHPFHVHGTQFQVLDRLRGGTRTPAPYLAWKDTVNVAAGETVRFRVRQDSPGLRMYHCHILEHEDQGMMGVLAVT